MIALFLAPIYIIINFYILRWHLVWLGTCSRLFRNKFIIAAYALLYTIISCSLLIAFLIKDQAVSRFFKQLSNYWLGTFLYILLTISIMDIIRIVIKHTGLSDNQLLFSKTSFIIFGLITVVIAAAASIYGIIHARHIYTTKYSIEIDKQLNLPDNSSDSLKIILVADWHLGYNVGSFHIKQMVEKINEANADLVCISGDIFDNEFSAVKSPDKICEYLRDIKSKYGVYACYGNHDIDERLLAGFSFSSEETKEPDPRMESLLTDAGITLLEDETLLIDNSFYIIGRKDYSICKKNNVTRKSPVELTRGLDISKPVILLDHQPKEMEQLSQYGIDLDLSGHTHDGQMFPGNLTCKMMWEHSYGIKKYNNMYSIVTSGIGVWGPNMRIGTKSEIVEINAKFLNKQEN